jgi:hypothetical protein
MFLDTEVPEWGKHTAVGGYSARVAPDNPQNINFTGETTERRALSK